MSPVLRQLSFVITAITVAQSQLTISTVAIEQDFQPLWQENLLQADNHRLVTSVCKCVLAVFHLSVFAHVVLRHESSGTVASDRSLNPSFHTSSVEVQLTRNLYLVVLDISRLTSPSSIANGFENNFRRLSLVLSASSVVLRLLPVSFKQIYN